MNGTLFDHKNVYMHETCVQRFKNNQIITASRRITISQEMTMNG